MGGVVSSGADNDELVDKLKQARYIKTEKVEKVFRLIDRANYITVEDRDTAYKDSAWKNGNLHLSAPCIYAQAMEGLGIEEGMTFLNIGSGTGYLSTMTGLLLGPKGISHGVELHSDVIEYAYERLEWFKSNSGALDVMEFCDPIFIQGNAFCLPDNRILYDRVYCGAACHEPHERYMKLLIKVGGVLVMPFNDQLLRITRMSEACWKNEVLLPVTFSPLVIPDRTHPPATLNIPPASFTPLQELCSIQIRQVIRSLIEEDDAALKKSFCHAVQVCIRLKSDSAADRDPSEPNSDQDELSDLSDSDGASYASPFDAHSYVVNQILEIRRSIVCRRAHTRHGRTVVRRRSYAGELETDDGLDVVSDPQPDVEMRDDGPNLVESSSTCDNQAENELDVQSEEIVEPQVEGSSSSQETFEDAPLDDRDKPMEVASEGGPDVLSANLSDSDANCGIMTESKPSTSAPVDSAVDDSSKSVSPITCNSKESDDDEDSLSSHSSNSSKKRARETETRRNFPHFGESKKREKFDSGVGEELEAGGVTTTSSSSGSSGGGGGDGGDSDSYDSDYNADPALKILRMLKPDYSYIDERKAKRKKRRNKNASSSKTDEEKKKNNLPTEDPVKKYTSRMRERIQALPLPLPLKAFINHNRDM